jgi:hypothetical protein
MSFGAVWEDGEERNGWRNCLGRKDKGRGIKSAGLIVGGQEMNKHLHCLKI